MRISAVKKLNPVNIYRKVVQNYNEKAHIKRMNHLTEGEISIAECINKLKEYYPELKNRENDIDFLWRQFDYYIYLNPQGTEKDIIAEFGESGKRMLDSYRSIGILSGSNRYRTTSYGNKQIENSIDLHMLSGK